MYSEKKPIVWRRNPAPAYSVMFPHPRGCRKLARGAPGMRSWRWRAFQQILDGRHMPPYYVPQFSVVGLQEAHVVFQRCLQEVIVLSELPFLPVPQFLLVFNKVLEPEADLMDAPGQCGGRRVQLLFDANQDSCVILMDKGAYRVGLQSPEVLIREIRFTRHSAGRCGDGPLRRSRQRKGQESSGAGLSSAVPFGSLEE